MLSIFMVNILYFIIYYALCHGNLVMQTKYVMCDLDVDLGSRRCE